MRTALIKYGTTRRLKWWRDEGDPPTAPAGHAWVDVPIPVIDREKYDLEYLPLREGQTALGTRAVERNPEPASIKEMRGRKLDRLMQIIKRRYPDAFEFVLSQDFTADKTNYWNHVGALKLLTTRQEVRNYDINTGWSWNK